jgi:mannose-6-phosphate isomerase-like protein (cupin superfamily)
MSFKLLSNYAVLSSNGNVRSTPGGDAFWAQPSEEIEKVGRDWLVTEHLFTASWDYQEIHPEADEFCYVVEGSVVLHLEASDGSGQQSVTLDAGSVFPIPRNMWHTVEVVEPVRMIFVTMGSGTDVRPNTDGSVA